MNFYGNKNETWKYSINLIIIFINLIIRIIQEYVSLKNYLIFI